MKFGRIEGDPYQIDFSLPRNDVLGKRIKGQSAGDLQIYVGAPAWGDKGFVGKIYPKGIQAKEYLYHYSRNFSCIELNTTFYRIPKKEVVQNWMDQSPDTFKFCPKVPNALSNLKSRTSLFDQFLEILFLLGERIGTVFLQLNQYFPLEKIKVLEQFLREWPMDIPLNIEFRHESWFANQNWQKERYEVLENYQVGAVITDTAGRRDVLHSTIILPSVFIRFTGNALHPTDFIRMDDWIDRIIRWQTYNLKSIYFIFHQPDEHLCVDTAIYFAEQYRKKTGRVISAPRILPGQQLSLL